MKLEIKAASKGHQEEGDSLIAKEGDEPAAREKGRRNPVAPPVEPVDLSIMAKKEAPKAPPTPAAAPAPPSKESVRERLAAALRGELKLPNMRKAEEAPAPLAPVPPTEAPVPAQAAPEKAEEKAPEAVPAAPTPANVPPAKPRRQKAPKAAPAQAAPAPALTTEPTERAERSGSAASLQSVVPPAAPAPLQQAKATAPAQATAPKPRAARKAPAPQPEAPAKAEAQAPAAAAPEGRDSTEAGAGAAPKAPPKRPMQARFTGMKPKDVVEAALFAAGKPVSVEEIAESTGLPPDSVKQGIKELQKDYEARDTMLEVSKAGTKWGMQVKSQAAEPAARFAPMEIAPKLLKTLALIAYHQPLKQSELVDMLGTKVYDHVPELIERGLVRAREEGITKILTTTPAFPEYFGLDATGPEEVRQVMGKLVGIEAPPKRKEPEAEPAAAPAEGSAEAAPTQGEPSGEPAGPTQA